MQHPLSFSGVAVVTGEVAEDALRRGDGAVFRRCALARIRRIASQHMHRHAPIIPSVRNEPRLCTCEAGTLLMRGKTVWCARIPFCLRGGVVRTRQSDDLDEVIKRLELRLEQYRIHGELLERSVREREGVDEIIKRMAQRLVELRLRRRITTGPALRTVVGDRRDRVAS